MSRLGTLTLPVMALLAAALLPAACASTGGVPRPFPAPAGTVPPATHEGNRPARDPDAPPATPVAAGYALAGTALSLRGTPYRNGGNDPAGFDCSGFIWYVFGQHGIRMPRTVTEQFREGIGVEPHALQAGDLVFFSTDSRGASHVGMAIGGDEFVHAPSARGDVRVERFSSRYWAPRFVGARRIN